MAEIIITEAPGGLADAYQCPFCGRMYLAKEVNTDGEITDVDADPPRNCKRCGSPMDIAPGKDEGPSLAQKFQEEMAQKAKTPEGPRTVIRRRTVKV